MEREGLINQTEGVLLLPSVMFSRNGVFDFQSGSFKIELEWDLTDTTCWSLKLTRDDELLTKKTGLEINDLPLLFEDDVEIAGTFHKVQIYDAANQKFACFFDGVAVADKALKTDSKGHSLKDQVIKYRDSILPKRAKAMETMMKWSPLVARETNQVNPVPFSPNQKGVLTQSFEIGEDTLKISAWKKHHLSTVEGAYNLLINGELVASRNKPLMHPGPLDGGESLVLDLTSKLGGRNSRLQITEYGQAFAVLIDGDVVISYFDSKTKLFNELSEETSEQMGTGEYFARRVLWFLPFGPVALDNLFGDEIIFFQVLLALWVVCNIPVVILKSRKSVSKVESNYPSNILIFLREQIAENPTRLYFVFCGLAALEIFLSLNDVIDFVELWLAFVLAQISVARRRIPMLLKLNLVYEAQDYWPIKRLSKETVLSLGPAIVISIVWATILLNTI